MTSRQEWGAPGLVSAEHDGMKAPANHALLRRALSQQPLVFFPSLNGAEDDRFTANGVNLSLTLKSTGLVLKAQRTLARTGHTELS